MIILNAALLVMGLGLLIWGAPMADRRDQLVTLDAAQGLLFGCGFSTMFFLVEAFFALRAHLIKRGNRA
ncbi:hypothetical protein C5E05_05960 [Pseudoclavibacter sp. AY1H1]|nr:hypothetical protein C5E05_05960 [Pseudoclavibacter sp. AY1H1]